MCGIAGIINFKRESVKKEDVKRMTDRMVYRGPDDEGFFIHENIGFGMRRLSIIDVQAGQQPITNEDASVWVVMNGEIYNYIELRDELKQKGHVFRTQSDTEVLVHGYEEYGVEFVHKLNGMFAFALYDKRRKCSWLVRDRLGIKPLYYIQHTDGFLFSSDLNTFPQIFRVHIDDSALFLYLGHGYVPTPRTLYRNIQKLPPGYALWIQNGKVILKEYWRIHQFETLDITQNEAEAQLHTLLFDALKLELRSDVPLAMMLSGGVDSSAITAVAATTMELPVNTFTVYFSEKGGEDGRYAREVSRQYHTNHSEIMLQPSDLLGGLDDLILAMDEPIADSAIIPTYLIAKSAREQGIRVMLSGAGGDELFGGYTRYFPPRFFSPLWVAEQVPRSLRIPLGYLWATIQPHRGQRAQDPRIAYLSGIFGADLGFYRKVLKKEGGYERLNNLLTLSIEKLYTTGYISGYAYRRMHFDQEHYLVDNILSLTDKATMAASIEGRVPLLDHRLVEFAFALPEKINLKEGQPKGLFKSILQPYLSTSLLNRKKEGFNAPIPVWMEKQLYEKVAIELKERLAPGLLDIVDTRSLEKYLRAAPRQPFLASTLYSLYVLNRWLRVHV